jgi:hypothetical protein
VLRTGERSLAFRVLPDAKFEPIEVKLGSRFGDNFELLERFKLTDKAFSSLRAQAVPAAVLEKLKALKDKEFDQAGFEEALIKILDKAERARFHDLYLKEAKVPGGLEEGDEIVTSAGFLIDAESRLKSATSAMGGHQHGSNGGQKQKPPEEPKKDSHKDHHQHEH